MLAVAMGRGRDGRGRDSVAMAAVTKLSRAVFRAKIL
jgi:hypothetical protein